MSGLLRKTVRASALRLCHARRPAPQSWRTRISSAPAVSLPAAPKLVFVGGRLFVTANQFIFGNPLPSKRHRRTASTQLAREQTRVIEIAEATLALDQPFQPRRIDAYERHRQPPSRCLLGIISMRSTSLRIRAPESRRSRRWGLTNRHLPSSRGRARGWTSCAGGPHQKLPCVANVGCRPM